LRQIAVRDIPSSAMICSVDWQLFMDVSRQRIGRVQESRNLRCVTSPEVLRSHLLSGENLRNHANWGIFWVPMTREARTSSKLNAANDGRSNQSPYCVCRQANRRWKPCGVTVIRFAVTSSSVWLEGRGSIESINWVWVLSVPVLLGLKTGPLCPILWSQVMGILVLHTTSKLPPQ
jgi:hypothetical protein